MFSTLIMLVLVLFVSAVVIEVFLMTEEWSMEEGWGDIWAYPILSDPEREGIVEFADSDSLVSLAWEFGILMYCCGLDSPFCTSLFFKWSSVPYILDLIVCPPPVILMQLLTIWKWKNIFVWEKWINRAVFFFYLE